MDANREWLVKKGLKLLKAMKNNAKRGVLPSLDPADYDASDPRMAAALIVNTLESVVEKKWPSGMISDAPEDNGGGTRRTIRTFGLSLIGIPEIVMEFSISEASAAMGIYVDLMHMALEDPKVACQEKLVPGRRVFAQRFKRKYIIHDAVNPCVCPTCWGEGLTIEANCNVMWTLMANMLPSSLPFHAVQIVLQPLDVHDDDGVNQAHVLAYCAACDKELPEQHKCCPCRAVAYCDRECQRKHWRFHKVMCATQMSLEKQLECGHEKSGVMK